ncbi:MAG: DUF3618 domain-containing protein [Pseudomonadota bacterium]|nr:DUF3618 domain-containing protein [Pseudomonadota bacterium]
MNNMNDTQDPAAIERDIRQTQDEMSRTVDKIGDQLTPKNIFNALLAKADENDVDARTLIDGARRNPIALGLIAIGAIWLVSDKDSKIPSLGSDKPDTPDYDDDRSHRDYVSHMSSVEMRADEDSLAYQRRRDMARSTYFMVERRPDEDDYGFRERLDSVADKFREKRRAWADSSGQAGDAAMQKGREAVASTQDAYSNNPLVGGMFAAAVGALFGSALPISRQEQEKLGSLGEQARDLASEKKDELTSQLREKKDELVEKADQKLQESGSDRQGAGTSTGTSIAGGGGQTDAQGQPSPFLIGEKTR